MKSITIKITARYEGWEDISDEIMFNDIVQSIAFRNDFDFELVEEEYSGMKCPVCGSEKTYQTQAIHCNHCAVTTEI